MLVDRQSMLSLIIKEKNITQIIGKILLAINIGLILSCVGFLVISIKNNYYWRADFTMFYTGGLIIRESLGSHLYDLNIQAQYQLNILQGGSFEDGLLPFNYPPYVALLFLPLTYIPLQFSFYIWMVIQFIFVGWLIILLMKISIRWEANQRRYLLAASLAMPSLMISILLGTFSILILISILQFYFSVKSDKYYQAGLWLSILALKPQFLIIPAIILIRSKQWRALAISFFIGCILFITSILLLGSQIWFDFFEIVQLSSTSFDIYGIVPGVMHNFKGAMTSILGIHQSQLINLVSFLAFLISILIVYIIWRGRWKPGLVEFDVKFALSITLAVLFALHVNPQDSLILIASLAIFYNYQILKSAQQQLYDLFLLSIPLLLWASEFWIKGSFIIRLPILIMLLLLTWISIMFLRSLKTLNIEITHSNP